MRRKLIQFLSLLAAGVLFHTAATSAQAGFIDSAELVNMEIGVLPGSSGGEQSPGELPAEERYDHQQSAANSSGGMNAPSMNGGNSPTTTVALVPKATVVSSGQLSLTLARQREPYHPRFIKTRVFRPPRS